MKKYVWIVALIAALAMVMTGCPEEGGGGDEKTVVIFKLTDEIAKMVTDGADVGTLLETSSTDNAFEGLNITNAGGIDIKIVQNGALYAFEIDTTDSNWGAGLDLVHSEIKFRPGDIINVKGEILEDFPAATASWDTPLLYVGFGPGSAPYRISKANPKKGSYTFDNITLTADDINRMLLNSPNNIRIGGRPTNAKFSITEITVSRPEKTPATYTVTFLGDNKTTSLGTVTGIESGLIVPPSTTSETWYTAFMGNIAAGKEFKGWYNLSGDTPWKLNENTVTTNVNLYAVLVDAEAVSEGFFKLGDLDADWWYANGTENKTTTLELDTLKAAKYLILDLVSVAGQNGFGGFQLALQYDTDSWGWHQLDVCGDWNQPQSSDGQWDIDYSNEDTFYIVVPITTLTSLISTDTTVTQAKLKLHNFPSQIEVAKAYLANQTVTLVKPATALDLTAGWAAQTVPEMAE